jgi:hypothetical protein
VNFGLPEIVRPACGRMRTASPSLVTFPEDSVRR